MAVAALLLPAALRAALPRLRLRSLLPMGLPAIRIWVSRTLPACTTTAERGLCYHGAAVADSRVGIPLAALPVDAGYVRSYRIRRNHARLGIDPRHF